MTQSSAQPEKKLPSSADADLAAKSVPSSASASIRDRAADSDKPKSILDEKELDSALQLLVERAQYITGATGAALALPQGEEMVCRASAGSSAPAVGARLQVRSGLTGESIARRQLLRCDNAEADPRVNLETCRALGIASIVVLPLMRKNGDVRGLFELFSDHPYAFEERDLIALERMADLTATALDLAEQRQTFTAAPLVKTDGSRQEDGRATRAPGPEAAAMMTATKAATNPAAAPSGAPAPEVSNKPMEPIVSQNRSEPISVPAIGTPLPETISASVQAAEVSPVAAIPVSKAAGGVASEPELIPEAMRRVRKCESCGFPVSEGRTLCLDCERAEAKKQREQGIQAAEKGLQQSLTQGSEDATLGTAGSEATAEIESRSENPAQEVLPPFLANAVPEKQSWLADHVNLLAIVVLILGILVAIVTFR
jgi:putative methionine-R-sulfoxide reductase with GAF domain